MTQKIDNIPLITNELLIEWNACTDVILTFNKFFPNGAYLQEAIDILSREHDRYAYWLFCKCREKKLYTHFISNGYYNSGKRNSGYYNSGYFNTTQPTVRLFNKETNLYHKDIKLPSFYLPITEWIPEDSMTEQQKIDNKDFYITGGILIERTYKEAWGVVWNKFTREQKQMFLDLPNFDKNIFFEITGIDINTDF